MSLVWMQYDEPSLHVPPSQSPEQHSALPSQGLPEDLQVVLNAWQLPASQFWLQQSVSTAQPSLSAVHASAPQLLSTQRKLQQSVGAVHAASAPRQELRTAAQVLESLSHTDEQQSSPTMQPSPNFRHSRGGLSSPPPPANPAAPPLALVPPAPAEPSGPLPPAFAVPPCEAPPVPPSPPDEQPPPIEKANPSTTITVASFRIPTLLKPSIMNVMASRNKRVHVSSVDL
jgi:hypothetical protein